MKRLLSTLLASIFAVALIALPTYAVTYGGDYNTGYSYNGYSSVSSSDVEAATAGIVGGLLLVMLLPIVIVCILFIVCNYKIFKKAGYKGWEAIIPIYNTYIMCKISNLPVWFVILTFIPGVNFFVSVYIIYSLAKSFGQGVGFTIGLLLLPVIFYPIFAFSKNITYVNSVPPVPGAMGAPGAPVAPATSADPWVSGNTAAPTASAAPAAPQTPESIPPLTENTNDPNNPFNQAQ